MNLPLSILRVLDRVSPRVMPETTLLAEVNLALPEPVTPSQLRRELVELDTKRQAVSVPDDDRGTVWMITSAGKARLAQ